MRERFISYKPGWVLRGGIILGLFAFSLGCEQRALAPENIALSPTAVPIEEYIGRNRLIMARSWCQDGKPVVEVRINVGKLEDPSGVSFLTITRWPRDSRVLDAIRPDQPGVVNGELVRIFDKETYTPRGLYNTDVPDFSVKEGEKVEFGNHKGKMMVERVKNVRGEMVDKSIPLFDGQADKVLATIISCPH